MSAPKPWSLREVHVYPGYYLELLDANGNRIVATNTFPSDNTEDALEEIVKMSKTMTDHTPAPWIYRPYTADILTANDDDMTLRIASLDYDPNIPPEQVEANAHLIAAAPDLLRDLKAIIEANPEWDDDLPEYMERARQSIAKAEGRG